MQASLQHLGHSPSRRPRGSSCQWSPSLTRLIVALPPLAVKMTASRRRYTCHFQFPDSRLFDSPDSDSDVSLRSNRGEYLTLLSWYGYILTQGTRLDVRRLPARPTFVAKRTKKVKFDVRDDSDSDGATVRAELSPHRVQQNLPTQSELSRSPQIVNQAKQSSRRKGELHVFSHLGQSW